MANIKLACTSDLEVPINEAFHEGRVVLVGKNLRKRIMHRNKNSGAIYVKWNGNKRYLSEGGIWVITNGVRK